MKKSTDDFSIRLGWLFRVARMKAGKTQKQVASDIGAHPTDVSRIEAGLQVPGIPRFMQLCEASNVKPWIAMRELAQERQKPPSD